MKKQVVTKTRSLTVETEKMLNNQILLEGKSSSYYLSMASWCDKEGYSTSADFLYRHSEEERQHMLKIFGYINDAGGHALQPEIGQIPHDFSSIREIFELILDHEIGVTQSINDLVDHCFSIRDFATFHFGQKDSLNQIVLLPSIIMGKQEMKTGTILSH